MLGRSIRAFVALCLVAPQIAHAEVGGNWMGGGRNSLLYGYAQPVPAGGCFPGTSVVLDIDPSNLSTLFSSTTAPRTSKRPETSAFTPCNTQVSRIPVRRSAH